MPVFPFRLSRAARVISPLSGMAIVFAIACGRDVTGTGGPRGILVLQKPSFQSVNVNKNGDDVVGLRVIISAFTSPTASASGTAAKVIADVTPNIDTLKNNGKGDNSDTVGVFKVSFPLQGSGFTYQVVLKAFGPDRDTLYVGSTQFSSNDVSAAGAVTVSLRPVYIGPGSTATRVVASPRSVTLVAFRDGLNTAQLSAQAFDASGTPLSKAFFNWDAVDTTIVGVEGNTGVVHALNKRGTTQVIVQARSATNPTDAVTVAVTFPASAVALVSGGGQTATINTALQSPIVVKTIARDGVPVGGTTLTVQPNGGSVSSTSITTNTAGTASFTWTLGPNVGTQSVNIFGSSLKSLQVSASATGTTTGGGNGGLQLTLLSSNSVIAAHGSTVPVTVLLQNSGTPVPNASVVFTPQAGSGSVSAGTVATDANGHAQSNWTLGPNPGQQSLVISAANASSITVPATVSASAVLLVPKPTSP